MRLILILFTVWISGIIVLRICFVKKTKSLDSQEYFLLMKKSRTIISCSPVYTLYDSTLYIQLLPGLGHYFWKITTKNDSAQLYFNQGMSLYYSFHLIEAIASFTKAAKMDSSCAMAWFGKALSRTGVITFF